MSEWRELNRALWDERVPIHTASDFYDVDGFVAGRSELRPFEREELGDVRGKTLVHLQCHFGLDTLSWARLGAQVTGADFSPSAIDAARSLAADVDIAAHFVVSDVYQLPRNLDGQFDIVYTSRGVLGWLPEIRPWAHVVAHFVKPGGIFYLTEIHPFAQVLDDEATTAAPGELRLRYPYWEHTEPLTFDVVGSYADRAAPTEGLRENSWNHALGEIVTALIEAGLTIEFVHEFDFVEWDTGFVEQSPDGRWRLPGDLNGRMPLSFSLRASKARS
jgi:SAM-dependent methyltransferase